jgi:predicted dehydrogenase
VSATVSTILIRRAGAVQASDKITIGFIGVGKQGRGHFNALLNNNSVEIVAASDVVKERLDAAIQAADKKYAARVKAGTFNGTKAYPDFRDLLKHPGLDAVLIATPDHWHAIPCVLAARAGKHIYCEKPLTRTIGEGRRVVAAVAEHKVIFQTGSQQRSEHGGVFRRAVELVRNGRAGKIKTIRVGVGDPAVPCDLPEQAAPEGADWNLWLGPAQERGYNEVLCPKGVHQHFPLWRKYREFANGGLADMGAHHFDIAQWALDMDHTGPVRIEPPASPPTTGLRFVYAKGIEMIHGGPSGCTFEGTAGTIHVDRDFVKSTPEAIAREPLGDGSKRVYHATNHKRNWIECIRNRKETICPAEVGHRTATICLLANIGYWLRRPLDWDPVKECSANDAEANALLDPKMRGPWSWE